MGISTTPGMHVLRGQRVDVRHPVLSQIPLVIVRHDLPHLRSKLADEHVYRLQPDLAVVVVVDDLRVQEFAVLFIEDGVVRQPHMFGPDHTHDIA